MTVEEKKRFVQAYCRTTSCDSCLLAIGGWKHQIGGQSACLYIEMNCEDDLDRAIKILETDKVKQNSELTEAIAYIETVLTWENWGKHHGRLVRALEIILSKIK